MRVSELLREALSQAKGTSPTKAIVDMSNVPFVDSAVLGIFVEYTRYFHNGGGSLYLAALNPFVKRSLQVTSLNKVFNVTESVDEAMTKTVG